MNELYKSAAEIMDALFSGKVSSVELIEAAIARIEQYDEKINAVVFRDFVRARASAKLADEALARGERKPLLGLPITVKESFNVAGMTTNWGNKAFEDWKPDFDSLVVQRLKQAGAIIIGKTNVPFMLGDWQSYNDIYGTTNNPWDISKTPGGSSGGSAAALAMGYVSLELGSDLAGSLRTPAHFCGVCAHKPSKNLLPLWGAQPPRVPPTSRALDFVVAGPMARSAHDLALALQVLAGPDEKTDGVGYQLRLPKNKHAKLSDFRVLLLDKHPHFPTASSIIKAQNELADDLQKKGVHVARTSENLPDLKKIACNYALLLGAWYSMILSPDDIKEAQLAVQKLAMNDDSLPANFIRGIIMSHADWLRATSVQDALSQQWKKLYNEFDVVLCPVMPTLAFPHDHSKDQSKRTVMIDGVPVKSEHQYIWVCIATLFGLPSTVVPIGISEEGLPVGIQIIGDYLQDYTTLAFGELIEKPCQIKNIV